MKNLGKIHYLILAIWFVINLTQAFFTGLHSDESYYWMYSQNLNWGYFDHPPMVAFLIYLGHSLLPGEIGVRLLIVLLSTATLALILNEVNEKKEFLFLSIFVFSFPLIHSHIAGFLAIPDIPLLFFTILFLILYKKHLDNPGWSNSILLGIVVAAMIYSKYHAFLVIGFTLLSNLKQFKNKFTYGILFISIVLLIPHILWQFNNDFPTFKYHLVERAKPLQFKYILPYLLGVILVMGPLSGILILWKLLKIKVENLFQRALIFNIAGFIVLFLIMSLKNRIEMHWLAAIVPMVMILTYPLIFEDSKTRKWFIRLAFPVVILLFLYRIYLAMDIIPNSGNLKITFYNRESNALQIKEMAKGRKVGFYNNYAAISNYMFYTGDSAVYLSTPDYRFCQYDLWDYQGFANGSDVFAIQSKHMNPPNLTKMTTGEMKGYIVIHDFQPLKGLNIEINHTLKSENEYVFEITLKNNNNFSIITDHTSNPLLAVKQNSNEIAHFSLSELIKSGKIYSKGKETFKISIPIDRISNIQPLQIYARTNENIRGELVAFKLN